MEESSASCRAKTKPNLVQWGCKQMPTPPEAFTKISTTNSTVKGQEKKSYHHEPSVKNFHITLPESEIHIMMETPLSPLADTRINRLLLPASPSLPANLFSAAAAAAATGADKGNNHATMENGGESIFSTPMSSPQQSPLRRVRDSEVFVRSRIEIFEGHSGGGQNNFSPGMMKKNESALQRAMVGREEAEAALSSTLGQLQESKARERKISERVQELVEEVAAVQERRGHEREVFEKEVRKARKEAFKISSVLVKCQEELKEVRGELGRAKTAVERERNDKEKAAQEAFERAYAVAGLVEEVERLKEMLKSYEREREGRVKEVLVEIPEKEKPVMTSIAVQTEDVQIEKDGGEPSAKTMNDGDTRSQAISRHNPHDTKEQRSHTRPESAHSDRAAKAAETATDETVSELKRQLRWLHTLHARDEELIEFLQLQCQFQACPACAESVEHPPSSQRGGLKHGQERKAHHNNIQSTSSVQEPQVGSTPEPLCKQQTISPSEPPKTALHQSGHEGSNRREDQHQLPPEAVPLPKSPEMSGFTPEPTALLEDMTQVLIQAASVPTRIGDSKTFSFSTSLTGQQHHQRPGTSGAANPTLRTQASQPSLGNLASMAGVTSTQVGDDDDLFNLSPPKKVPPPRPSTALGLTSSPRGSTSRTQPLPHQSPIRMVPKSPPKSNSSSPMRTVRIPGSRPKSAMSQRSQPLTPATGSRKIPLRGSDETGSPVRRSGARPRRRSPTPANPDLDIHQNDMDDLASPRDESAIVSPPLAPAFRVPLRPIAPQTATVTTTVTVPLKGYDHVFSPPPPQTESMTMPLANHHLDDQLPVGPGTPISRAEALRQIRERRDRARSMNLKGLIKDQREVSGMSAPGRI